MDMVARAMRERARCIALLKQKYPGLPYYDVDTLSVLEFCSGFKDLHSLELNSSERPGYTNKEYLRSRYWDRRFSANSILSSVLGREFIWKLNLSLMIW